MVSTAGAPALWTRRPSTQVLGFSVRRLTITDPKACFRQSRYQTLNSSFPSSFCDTGAGYHLLFEGFSVPGCGSRFKQRLKRQRAGSYDFNCNTQSAGAMDVIEVMDVIDSDDDPEIELISSETKARDFDGKCGGLGVRSKPKPCFIV